MPYLGCYCGVCRLQREHGASNNPPPDGETLTGADGVRYTYVVVGQQTEVIRELAEDREAETEENENRCAEGEYCHTVRRGEEPRDICESCGRCNMCSPPCRHSTATLCSSCLDAHFYCDNCGDCYWYNDICDDCENCTDCCMCHRASHSVHVATLANYCPLCESPFQNCNCAYI